MNADATRQVRLTAGPLVARTGWDAAWLPRQSPSIPLLQTPEYQRASGLVASESWQQESFSLRST